MPFIFSCCLISLPIVSRTMLNKCSKSRHLCLAPNFRGKTFSISNSEVAVNLSQISFTWLRKLSSIPSLLSVFYNKAYWILSSIFLHLLQ